MIERENRGERIVTEPPPDLSLTEWGVVIGTIANLRGHGRGVVFNIPDVVASLQQLQHAKNTPTPIKELFGDSPSTVNRLNQIWRRHNVPFQLRRIGRAGGAGSADAREKKVAFVGVG